jgi:hypothetical protein
MAVKPSRPAAAKDRPPDERFWVKYSPHHELPISGMASLAWHTFAVVLIVVVGFIVAGSRANDMPIETIELDFGGGGGNPNGIGDGSALAHASPRVEAALEQELPPDAVRPNEPLTDITDLKIPPKDLLQGLEDDIEAQRELAKITDRGTQALKKLANLDKQLRDGLMGTPGKGQGGPGSGGGDGSGVGKGQGPGEGDGKLNVRTKRKLRWTITFNTSSGSDYLRQLNVLGAILAFRHPDGDVRVVKDLLRRPVKLENEDLQALNRIFWIDDKHESVEKLVRALGLDFTPNQVVALFPYEFEKQLLAKELAFRNKREEQIHETRFLIMVRGSRYEIYVTDQRLNQ